MEKTHFSPQFLATIETGLSNALSRMESIGQNDIYTWVFGWQTVAEDEQAHMKMTLICPATDELIAKYSTPNRRMILETPQMYKTVTKPWIDSLPASKTAWVRNILQGVSEQGSILYSDEDPKSGFVLLPDMKWDRRSLSSLYLVAIVRDDSLKTMRDLTKEHIPLLRKIQMAGTQVARDNFGLSSASADGSATPLRCYLHYMPTYFHLHVHLLSANFTTHPGALVGQAHLLEDVISLLDLGVAFTDRTMGYAMSDGHPLLQALHNAGYAL
ncbi:5'-(N(7)-methyl 5'-triphosphoguanosine)-[mRNA] diphosphatase [Malassezia caprae]|uniref:5'-(N(7)-methyl 5'-triphosphoguanosine)-[mRNA] diphosphatase n=1 Tax=Malassezia caprae TaxID=1381934 RepID=A0AAF0E3Z3_9BASI|nr:5'-(N(7)-methyl 5'-triphosphoguanosine)-[mRNA] diphosphatase [Malassezia caprae]